MLDDLFADARELDATPSSELMSRVLGSAAQLQPDVKPLSPTGQGPSLWSQFMDVIGGWPALGGVAAAGVTGLWLGLAPTASMDSFAAELLGDTTAVSFIQDYDFLSEDAFDG